MYGKLVAVLFLSGSDAASGSCVTMRQYADNTCSGNNVKEMNFTVGEGKGSPCLNFGKYSVKDQFCDSDGTFKQTAFMGDDCKGDGMDQVYDLEHCTYNYQASCAPGKCEASSSPPAESEATVTLKQYSTDDCSGEFKEITFPARAEPGSPCTPLRGYAVKDQYCDADGKFKQTVFMGDKCETNGADQVFDKDTCLYKLKLGSCTINAKTEIHV